MGRFETEMRTQPANLDVLADFSGQWIDHLREAKPLGQIILDMDSSVSETCGQQEGSAYNGHFACTFYHPLFCFNQFGDLERTMLHNGNVHGADDWATVPQPIAEARLARIYRAILMLTCCYLLATTRDRIPTCDLRSG